MKNEYDKLPTDKGVRYILLSKCCLEKAYTTECICGKCKKICDLIKFHETEILIIKNQPTT